MPSNIGLYLVRFLSFAACCLSSVICYAQSYPTHPIQVIVPFAGGSASDVITRVVLERMGEAMGRRFIIDNRPGAGGNTGTAAAARAEPDGYTLVMSTSGPLAANKTLYQDLGYDPEKDFAPIGLFAMIPNIIVVSTKLPITSLDEFIAYAKAHPSELRYGSVGIGSSQHLAGAYFEQITGTAMTHVPYRNIAQYVTDLIAGTVPTGFQFLPNVSGPLATGDARALAVTSANRMQALPEVPTAVEAGLNGYQSSGWLALLAPAGTPAPIIATLHQQLVAAMADPAVRARLVELGAEPVVSTPAELATFIRSETAKWHDIIVNAGVGQL